MHRVMYGRLIHFVLALIVLDAGTVSSQVVVDSGRHHLGTAGRPEWQEFAGVKPEGRSLELRFDMRARGNEATLLIRQRCQARLGRPSQWTNSRAIVSHGDAPGPCSDSSVRHFA